MSNKTKKKASTEELATIIQSLISQALFLNWFIEEKFSHLSKYEKISRKGKTGIAVKLSDESGRGYEITLFPLMSGLFKGETTIGEKKCEFIVGSRNPDRQKPSIEFLTKDDVEDKSLEGLGSLFG